MQVRQAASAKPTKDYTVSASLAAVGTTFQLFQQMNWQFGTLPDLEPDFITSDNPVLLVVPPGDLVGLAHPEIDVKLSLSRRVVAIANWDGKPGYGLLAEGAANQINEETMRRAKRFLFASSKSDKLLKRAKELYNTGPKIRVRRVKMGQGLAIIPEYR